MTGVVRYAVRAVGAASAVAALAALGLPAVAVAAGLAVLLLVAGCWVLGSRERSDHLARIILGLRGDARCLYSLASPEHDASPTPAVGAPDGPRGRAGQQALPTKTLKLLGYSGW